MHDLETRVLEMIGENVSSPDVFTDDATGMAPIRDALNDAIQEIVMVTGGNKTTYLVPLVAEQMFYTIDGMTGYLGWVTDAWMVSRERRLEQTGLLKVTRHDPRWMITSAEPRSYFPIGKDIIGLYPKPSAVSDILELTIVEIPKEYTLDNAKVNVRKEFEYAAVQYAVAEYWASRGDADEAITHYNLYAQTLGLNDDYQVAPYQKRTLDTVKESVPTETA